MKVLISTDGSDDAIAAARHALAVLAPAETVTLVCVVEPPAIEAAGMESGMAGGIATADEIDSAWAAINAEAAVALDRTEAALAGAVPSGTIVERVSEEGAAGPAVCRLAEIRAVDVVVVGSRGRGAIRRALMGSVSTHIVNNAPCPVLVVRTGTDGEG
jgi:nucleotide-binding universal stress UspA family protein